MRKNSSSSHETSDLARRDGPVSDADLPEKKFRALCDQIVREKQTPITPANFLEVWREAHARIMAELADKADAGADPQTSDISNEEFLAIRKAAGLKIDPRTAAVTWCYADIVDPYGIGECVGDQGCVRREYYARAPGCDIWVAFPDLPQETRDALWKAHKHELAFPAGLDPSPGLRLVKEGDS
jgi:hypothetical protein